MGAIEETEEEVDEAAAGSGDSEGRYSGACTWGLRLVLALFWLLLGEFEKLATFRPGTNLQLRKLSAR